MPSVPFSGRLSQLVSGATERQKNQSKQNYSQDHLTYRSRNAFHHVSLFEIQAPVYNKREISLRQPDGVFLFGHYIMPHKA